MRRRYAASVRQSRGFSLIEIIFVVAIMSALLTIATLFSQTWLTTSAADSGLQQVLRAFRTARERAIAERRNIEIRFVGTNQIQVVRRDVVETAEVGTTLLETVTLESTMRFRTPAGVTDLTGMDNLVPGTGADGINRGTATAQLFTSEGTFVDQNGDPLNLEVFVARRNDPQSCRAVTVFGPTALIHGLRWNGRNWRS
jgi:prepilin-type N-terminal cleavage/methylation domain-containing protein